MMCRTVTWCPAARATRNACSIWSWSTSRSEITMTIPGRRMSFAACWMPSAMRESEPAPGSSRARTIRLHCIVLARAGNTLRNRSSYRTRPTASRCLIRRRDGRHDLFGVPKLGKSFGRATPVHGPAHVEHDGCAGVGFFLELLHHPPIGAGDYAPVDKAQIVTRLVLPVLGEFDRETFLRGTV